MSNYKVGQKVFINSSSNYIGSSIIRVSTGEVKAVSPTGVVKVSVTSRNGVDKFDMSFMPNGRQRGEPWGGASLISEERYLDLLDSAEQQKRERAARNALVLVGGYAAKPGTKEQMLDALVAARRAIEEAYP